MKRFLIPLTILLIAVGGCGSISKRLTTVEKRITDADGDVVRRGVFELKNIKPKTTDDRDRFAELLAKALTHPDPLVREAAYYAASSHDRPEVKKLISDNMELEVNP